MREFKVGDRVRIKGDYSDFTDHLHGCVGTIVEVDDRDCLVDVEYTVDDTPCKLDYYIWNYNMELVDGD